MFSLFFSFLNHIFQIFIYFLINLSFTKRLINIMLFYEKEILSLLYKNNYDLAKAKMNNILKGENDIAIYDLIKPLLEILKIILIIYYQIKNTQ